MGVLCTHQIQISTRFLESAALCDWKKVMMKDDTKRKSLSSALLVKLFVCEALPFYLQRPQGTQQETSTGWSQLQFQALATLQPNYESVFLSLLYSIQNTLNTFSKRFHRLPNSMMLRVCSWLLTSSSTEQVALAVLEIHITSQIHWDNEDIYIYIHIYFKSKFSFF